MKKILLTGLALLFFSINILAKDEWKLLGGLAMCAAGVYMGFDGLKDADRSNPGLDASNWSWYDVETSTNNYTAYANGTLQNTGNVNITSITLTITFKDMYNSPITNKSVYLSSNLSQGNSSSWNTTRSYYDTNGGGYYANLSVDYTYEKIIEKNNATEGIIGVGLAIWGGYLVWEYFAKPSRDDDDMEFSIKYPTSQELVVVASKNF